MDPKSGRLQYFIGVLYKQDGNEDKALQSFHKAKELDKRIEEADSEIRLIQTRRAKKGKGSAATPAKAPAGSDAKDAKGDKSGEKKKPSFLDRLRMPIGGNKK